MSVNVEASATADGLPPVIQPAEVAHLLNEGADVKIVDIRAPAEFEAVHIPGSYNLPLDQLPEHAKELRGRVGAPIVLVCRSGERARQAEMLLSEAEVPRLHVLDGGLVAWDQAALQVQRGRARWSIERQVRAIAGSLVLIATLGSLLVWPPMIFLAVFAGAGLLFAGLTDTCVGAMLLSRLPYNRGPSRDVAKVIGDIASKPARP